MQKEKVYDQKLFCFVFFFTPKNAFKIKSLAKLGLSLVQSLKHPFYPPEYVQLQIAN